jgi:hypothetical protein
MTLTEHCCPECDEPMPEGLDCHHHNMTEETELGGLVHVTCLDCPYHYTIDLREQ